MVFEGKELNVRLDDFYSRMKYKDILITALTGDTTLKNIWTQCKGLSARKYTKT